MSRGSKPGERRGGRKKGTPNKKTVLKNAVFCAAAANPDTSPLDFMLGLMRDPNVPSDLRLDMAVGAAPFVHAKPQVPPLARTNPMRGDIIKSPHEFALARMEAGLRAPQPAGGNRLCESPSDLNRVDGDDVRTEGIGQDEDNGGGQSRAPEKGQQDEAGEGLRNGAAWKGQQDEASEKGQQNGAAEKGQNGAGEKGQRGGEGEGRQDGVAEKGQRDRDGERQERQQDPACENAVGEKEVCRVEKALSENQLGVNARGGVDANGLDLSPLQFLLRVMRDADATPKQRIKAARAAARYQHVLAALRKSPAKDEFGFAIDRALANAIKDDWFALGALDHDQSSKAAQKRFAIRARQAERDEFLQCPQGYSAERDLERRGKLLGKRRRMGEEPELAFVMARITASEAAFNRSPEGRARRRLRDLKDRREAANYERNPAVGLTRAEGKELAELEERFAIKLPRVRTTPMWEAVERHHDLLEERFQRDRELRRQQAANGSDPDSEMEELRATTRAEFAEWEAEQIARRRAAGDPDPWDGLAPTTRIVELESKRYLGDTLTPAEEQEMQEIAGVYPEEAERVKKLVDRRLCGVKLGRKMYPPRR